MDNEFCLIILNPASGGGRTGQIVERLESAIRSNCRGDLRRTERAGHAAELARQGVLEGRSRIVVVGGDGTIHECVNGIAGLPPAYARQVSLGIISTGTGCGLARSLGIPADFDAQCAVAFGPECRTIDLGRLRFDATGETRYFVNECQIGIGVEVVRKTGKGTKALGGSLAYTLATVPLLFTFPNPEVTVRLDDSEPVSLPVTGISIGNGAVTAGGMRLTPHAVLDDGMIDVLIMKGQTPCSRARGFLRVRSGEHINSPAFDYHQIRRIRISSSSQLPVSADGELAGHLPVTIETVADAMRVHAPTLNTRSTRYEHIHTGTEAARI